MKQRVGYLPENPYFYDYSNWLGILQMVIIPNPSCCAANAFPSY